MLTVGKLREQLQSVPDDVVVALVTPSTSGDLQVIRSVDVEFSGGPVLKLRPVTGPPMSGTSDAPKFAEAKTRQPHATDFCVDLFGFAVARAGCFELKARLLADKTSTLQKTCLSADLLPLCRAIANEYSAALSAEERHLLEALPGLRNKLLHVELSRAQGRVKPFIESLKDAGVTKVDLRTGDTVSVASSSTMQGRLFGWLLEAATSGAFTVAADLFLDGVVLVERLAIESDRRSDVVP
jgi:hypothetical protein